MDGEEYTEGPCPIARGLRRIGDTWSMLILRNAGAGQTRFEQFQKSLGTAPNILTRRLAALTADGLLERRRYSERPPRDEYVLTAKGLDFLPVLYALGEWGGRHFPDGPLTQLVEAASGEPVRPMVVDRISGRVLGDMALRTVRPIGSSA